MKLNYIKIKIFFNNRINRIVNNRLYINRVSAVVLAETDTSIHTTRGGMGWGRRSPTRQKLGEVSAGREKMRGGVARPIEK